MSFDLDPVGEYAAQFYSTAVLPSLKAGLLPVKRLTVSGDGTH